MSISFTVTIDMKSDWHIGIGQGRQRSVDRLVDRDEDDLPYIAASALRGLWRDAAQMLAYGLDEGEHDGAWAALPDQILGSEPVLDPRCSQAPTPSRVTLSHCRFPPNVRSHFAGSDIGRQTVRQALTFVKPGVAIDRKSGRARENFLRTEETARRGAVLQTSGTLECPDEHKRAVIAFLTGAAALIKRIGGKRRRGLGKCEVSVDFGAAYANDASAAADVLGNIEQPPRLEPLKAAKPETRVFGDGADKNWIAIPLRLSLQSPVIVADDVQGNVVTCQNAIPGSLLLPYIAKQLEDAGINNAWSLISDGEIRVSPATPEIDGQRSLPVPYRWEKPKLAGSDKPCRLIPKAVSDDATQYTPIREGFVSPDDSAKLAASVEKTLRTHNTIEDRTQRPDESVGGVYSYEAIAPGQTFRSEVWLRHSGVPENEIRKALGGSCRIGRARHAGYGQVEIAVDGTTESTARGAPSTDRTQSDVLCVWMTSDAIISDGSAGGLLALADAIAGVFGRARDTLFEEATGAHWGNLRWRRIDGWQSQWGLPRPTLTALEAGSVAELKLRDGVILSPDDIKRLEDEGIGERKGEGFGCILLDHEFLSAAPARIENVASARDDQAQPTRDDAPLPARRPNAFAQKICRHAWERCIALRSEIAVRTAKDRDAILSWRSASPDAKPPMSQLGALRSVMGKLSEDDIGKVEKWLDHLRKIRGRKGKWPADSNGDALKKLQDLLTDPDAIWQRLELSPDTAGTKFNAAPKPADCVGFNPLFDSDLRRYAVRTLLFQAMRAHKREVERRSNVPPAGDGQ